MRKGTRRNEDFRLSAEGKERTKVESPKFEARELELRSQPGGLKESSRRSFRVEGEQPPERTIYVVLKHYFRPDREDFRFAVRYRGREAGGIPVSEREPQAPPPPVAKHRAVEGLRRSCAWACSVWS
jgi:hypothetical protein